MKKITEKLVDLYSRRMIDENRNGARPSKKIPEKNIRGRLEKGWQVSDAFLQPLGMKIRKKKIFKEAA